MTAKEYLKQYEKVNKEIIKFEKELAELQDSYDQIRSVTDYDGMPHGSNIGHPTEEKAIKVSDMRMKYVDALNRRIEIRAEVFDVVMQTSGIKQDVLYSRYIDLMRWDDIAELCNYSLRTIHNVHRRALEDVAHIITNDKHCTHLHTHM